MSWKDRMSEFGGLQATFLTEDGETITFLIIGEPQMIIGKFKKKETKRIAAPIISVDGFSIFVMGMRLARRISKYENIFDSNAFVVTRHGEKGDQNAQYDFDICDDADLTKRLLDYKDAGIDKAEVIEAMDGVKEVIEG